MKIIKIIKITGIIVLTLTFSCIAPEEWGDKYDSSIVPPPVVNLRVENVNGGAVLSYALPYTKDLLGAKVVYSLTDGGKIMERFASVEKDTIVLEGFGDTKAREVIVYTMHKNGKLSEGKTATIQPLAPPIAVMRATMKVTAAFSGVRVTWDNPMRKNMGIALYVQDSINHNEMVLYDKYFSNSSAGKVVIRGFDAKEQRFRIEMFDRWQNHARDLDTLITPLYERKLPPRDENRNPIWSMFDDGRVIPGNSASPLRRVYRCEQGDHDPVASPFSLVFDWPKEPVDGTNIHYWETGHNPLASQYIPGLTPVPVYWFPFYLTFDMGKKAIYSRFRYIPRAKTDAGMYSAPFYNHIVVWGSNDPKMIEDVEDPRGIYPIGSREANQAYWSAWPQVNGTDAWKNDWVKLGTCKVVLSSGESAYTPGMILSEEDIRKYLFDGYEFEFDEGILDRGFRYLRWEILGTNYGRSNIGIRGIEYWGNYVDEQTIIIK